MNEEEKNQLRMASMRLWGGETMAANKDAMYILAKCLFKIILDHGKEPVKNQAEAESKLIVQMIFSKLLNLNKIVDGVDFDSKDEYHLNNVIDPTVIAILVRTIYETIATFYLIYIKPNSDDEKLIMYNLWVVAGLKFRQRFASNAKSEESKMKLAYDAQKINDLEKAIRNTTLYNSLSEKGQFAIDKQLKDKDFKVFFDKGNVIQLSWSQITQVMGMKEDLMDNMYTYFSLYSHPSNVAVFQFRDLFNKAENPSIGMSNFNVSNAIKLIGFFIAEYISLYPETRVVFESLPLIDQIMINYHSRFFRVDKVSINQAISVLD